VKIHKAFDPIEKEDGSLWISTHTAAFLLGLTLEQTNALIEKLHLEFEDTYSGRTVNSNEVLALRDAALKLNNKKTGDK